MTESPRAIAVCENPVDFTLEYLQGLGIPDDEIDFASFDVARLRWRGDEVVLVDLNRRPPEVLNTVMMQAGGHLTYRGGMISLSIRSTGERCERCGYRVKSPCRTSGDHQNCEFS